MNEQYTNTENSMIDLEKISTTQLEQLIIEGNKILKKRKDNEIKQFQADIRKKAKAKGLKVSFEEIQTRARSKSSS